MIDHYERIGASWGRLCSRFSRPAPQSLEEKMTVQTDNLLAAAKALKTTADALAKQGTDATAAGAAAEAAAQSAIDGVTSDLAAANSELAPLVTSTPTPTPTPAPATTEPSPFPA